MFKLNPHRYKNIKPKPIFTEKMQADMIELYKAGYSGVYVAKRYGCNTSHIYEILKLHNVPIHYCSKDVKD